MASYFRAATTSTLRKVVQVFPLETPINMLRLLLLLLFRIQLQVIEQQQQTSYQQVVEMAPKMAAVRRFTTEDDAKKYSQVSDLAQLDTYSEVGSRESRGKKYKVCLCFETLHLLILCTTIESNKTIPEEEKKKGKNLKLCLLSRPSY